MGDHYTTNKRKARLDAYVTCCYWTVPNWLTSSLLIWRWRSNWHWHWWHHYEQWMFFSISNIDGCRMTSWYCRLKMSRAHRNLLDDAIVVFVLQRVENPAVRPREAEERCQSEVAAVHPAPVRITYGQFLDVARKIVFHGEIDVLISASVGVLEQFKCLVVDTLRLVVRKLNCLLTACNNCTRIKQHQTTHNYICLTNLSCYLTYPVFKTA